MTLTLDEARREGRLREFIRQQERWERENGYAGADKRVLERGLEAAAKAQRPKDRTSRSRDDDSSI